MLPELQHILQNPGVFLTAAKPHLLSILLKRNIQRDGSPVTTFFLWLIQKNWVIPGAVTFAVLFLSPYFAIKMCSWRSRLIYADYQTSIFSSIASSGAALARLITFHLNSDWLPECAYVVAEVLSNRQIFFFFPLSKISVYIVHVAQEVTDYLQHGWMRLMRLLNWPCLPLHQSQ